jgi:hypothetical protein
MAKAQRVLFDFPFRTTLLFCCLVAGAVAATREPSPLGAQNRFRRPDIAATDFESSHSAPFKAGSGSTRGSANIQIIDDPTGQLDGKVASFHFARRNPNAAPDVDRALRFVESIPMGETVFVRGHVVVPEPPPAMRSAMRKLIYVQTGRASTSFCVVRANGNRLFVEFTGTGRPARVERAGTFAFNTRQSLELQITLNSAPGLPDGVLRLWKDGTLVLNLHDVNWINAASAHATFGRFLFGQQTQADRSSTFDEFRYWDNLAISHSRIGP